MANVFDQFDAPEAAPADPATAQDPQAVAGSAPAQQQAANPFDQFDPPAQQPGRDALGGYLLPPAPPVAPAQPSGFLAQVDNVGRSLAQGATLGFGDELAAGADAATHGLLGRGSDAPSFSERYDANLADQRARDASIPNAIAIPGQLAGGLGTMLVGAPAAVAKGAVGAARLIPGVNALADVGAGAGEAVGNALSRIPGASVVAPAAKIAAEGAAYGGVQGFGDGEGGLDNRLQSAGIGAATGAAIAPAVAGVGTLIGKGWNAAGRTLSEAGWAGKAPIVDAAGKPIIGSDGQPVAATSGVTRVAGQQVADSTSDLPAARAALDAHVGAGWRIVDPYPAPDGSGGMTTIAPDQYADFMAGKSPPPAAPLLPGDKPTTFQVTGDYGQGQKELELRTAPGSSQAFLQRTADQNAARVGAIEQSVPPEASSADLQNSLTQQQTALQAERDAAAARAGQGTLNGDAPGTPVKIIDHVDNPALGRTSISTQVVESPALGGHVVTRSTVSPFGEPTSKILTKDGQWINQNEVKGVGGSAGGDALYRPSDVAFSSAEDANAAAIANHPDLSGMTKAGNTVTRDPTSTGVNPGIGGAADSTPVQAGADLRGSIDQARAPVIQQADAAVQQGQEQAGQATGALGGVLPEGASPATAAQHYGQQFRTALDSNAQDSKTSVNQLYAAIDPDGTLAVNMQPAREAARSILSDMPQNAAPLAGEEAAIFGTMAHLPDAQSFRELGALNNRVTTAMRAARSDPAQAQSYARLSQLRGGLANILQDSVEGQVGHDAAAARAGTAEPNQTIIDRLNRWADTQRDAANAIEATGTGVGGRGVSSQIVGSGAAADAGPLGAEGQTRGGFRGASGNPSLPGQAPPLVANADQAAADRIAAANAGYAEHKSIYGAKAPGVGPVLAPGQTQGTFNMLDSQVPSAIFSKGAGAAERVQAAIRAGLPPSQIADYAAYSLRGAAQRADGTLNPADFARWRQQHGEALQALTRADPTIAGRFDSAQQAAQRLVELQTQRAAIDATHPLKPGWGDAEVMQRVWQGGPKGADSVRQALAGANGSPVAAKSIADYAAYSLRKAAAPDGVINPAKYATWARAYDGALSARPDIKAQFDTAADAQRTLNATAEQHARALQEFQRSVARHFLDGAEPADRIGQILNSATRQRDMAELARLTANDPAARAGIQRAVVDHIFNRLQGNSLAGQTGIEKLKSDQLQTFIHRAGPALHDVMTPQQVETLRKVALTLQRDNMSVDAVRVAGGSDTTQKVGLQASGAAGSNLMAMVKAHGLTGLLTILGAKVGGPVVGFLGNKAGAGMAALKAAGISKTNDLVKEAMLNPALAQALLAKLTPANERDVAGRALTAITRLSAVSGAHTAVAVDNFFRPKQPPIKLNSLAGLGAAMSDRPNALSAVR